MRQRTGKTSNKRPCRPATPLILPGGEKRSIGGMGRTVLSIPSSLGAYVLVLGTCFWSETQLHPHCILRLCPPPRRCRGGSAALRRYGGRCRCPLRLSGPGPGGFSCPGSAGNRPALLPLGWFQHIPLSCRSLGDGDGTTPGGMLPGRAWGASMPGAGCGRPPGPTELIPIVSRSPIVIPDHKEPGGNWGADTRQASLRSPCLS